MSEFKIAFGPALDRKIPHGDPYWPKFNASFENMTVEPIELANRLYNGQPITTWHKDHWRTTGNYLLGQHIGIDFDTGDQRSSLATLSADPFISKYANIVYTTPSHTPEAPRARVIFLLDIPIIQPANYTAAASAMLWVFGSADRQCKDPVRFFYGGKPGSCDAMWLGDGENVLPLAILKDLIGRYRTAGAQAHRHMTGAVTGTVEQKDVAAALRTIPALSIDYDQWLAVLMAIHSQFPGADGLTLAEQWAEGKPGEVAQKWRSFKPAGNASGSVTIASLFKLARENGYVTGN